MQKCLSSKKGHFSTIKCFLDDDNHCEIFSLISLFYQTALKIATQNKGAGEEEIAVLREEIAVCTLTLSTPL